MKAKEIFTRAFQDIGIEIGKDIVVLDDRFYSRVLKDHSIGLGESYIAGWWEAPCILSLFQRILPGIPTFKKYLLPNFHVAAYYFFAGFLNRQLRKETLRDVQSHYDIGNELYETMLDKNMIYTCAYFKDPSWTLEQAQEAKIDLVYKKLHIPEKFVKGHRLRVLDIGCGWGFGLIHGARRYGIEGVGITLSEGQVELARRQAKGLPIEIRLQDYRDLPEDEKFDAVFSLGMFEHVGQKNYRKFMKIVSRHLKEKGLFLLHTIGGRECGPVDPWVNKYIFPSAYIPSRAQLAKAVEGIFIEQDFHNFGLYYTRTVKEWLTRFEEGWNQLKSMRPDFYNDRFYRMWKYYLNIGASSFFTGRNYLWQIVYSKRQLDNVYESVR